MLIPKREPGQKTEQKPCPFPGLKEILKHVAECDGNRDCIDVLWPFIVESFWRMSDISRNVVVTLLDLCADALVLNQDEELRKIIFEGFPQSLICVPGNEGFWIHALAQIQTIKYMADLWEVKKSNATDKELYHVENSPVILMGLLELSLPEKKLPADASPLIDKWSQKRCEVAHEIAIAFGAKDTRLYQQLAKMMRKPSTEACNRVLASAMEHVQQGLVISMENFTAEIIIWIVLEALKRLKEEHVNGSAFPALKIAPGSNTANHLAVLRPVLESLDVYAILFLLRFVQLLGALLRRGTEGEQQLMETALQAFGFEPSHSGNQREVIKEIKRIAHLPIVYAMLMAAMKGAFRDDAGVGVGDIAYWAQQKSLNAVHRNTSAGEIRPVKLASPTAIH